jgi:hypothetical protein
MSEQTSNSAFQIPCRHMRSNEMFHQALGEYDQQDSGSGQYWCGKSHEPFGMDGEPVEKSSCCPGRSCYQS